MKKCRVISFTLITTMFFAFAVSCDNKSSDNNSLMLLLLSQPKTGKLIFVNKCGQSLYTLMIAPVTQTTPPPNLIAGNPILNNGSRTFTVTVGNLAWLVVNQAQTQGASDLITLAEGETWTITINALAAFAPWLESTPNGAVSLEKIE